MNNQIESTFRYILNSKKSGSDLIDEKMIENECTNGPNNFPALQRALDSSFKNYAGNIITRGLRMHKSGKIVEFIIENSYQKDQENKRQKELQINND